MNTPRNHKGTVLQVKVIVKSDSKRSTSDPQQEVETLILRFPKGDAPSPSTFLNEGLILRDLIGPPKGPEFVVWNLPVVSASDNIPSSVIDEDGYSDIHYDFSSQPFPVNMEGFSASREIIAVVTGQTDAPIPGHHLKQIGSTAMLGFVNQVQTA